MGPRDLIQQKIQTTIKKATDGLPEDSLSPGHMRLYSYFKPSLEAGNYGIEARQKVFLDAQDDLKDTTPLFIWNYTGTQPIHLAEQNGIPNTKVEQQKLEVVAPQFSIDSKAINSFYPPQGHQDEGDILPHIVFNDPHMPWLRYPGLHDPFHGPVDFDNTQNPSDPTKQFGSRNMVPWMALFCFDPTELQIPADNVPAGLEKIASYDPKKLPLDGAFSMKVKEYLNLPTNRIYYDAAETEFPDLQNSDEGTSIIFPTRERLEGILGNKTDLASKLGSQKYMSHVRHIKTNGFPDAGVQQDGWFSIVISSMTGEVEIQVPTTQVVHLVSLEHYDATVQDDDSPFNKTKTGTNLPLIGKTDRVGMVSLHSWIYTAIPQAVDFVATMESLVGTMQPLRPPDSVLQQILDGIPQKPTAASKRAALVLHDRLKESYTISRWRTATGEETAVFNRGPLVASPPPALPVKVSTDWPVLSMSGKDYQIFDRELGIMDLTYSNAWSLGRLAAISDSPFNAALLRFRSLTWKQSASKTRMAVNGIDPQSSIIARLPAAIADAHSIQPDTFVGPVSRINPPSSANVAPPITHPAVRPVFNEAMKEIIGINTRNDLGERFYSDFELAKAANTDWELIHHWISDSLYLGHIPAHHLFPEPSYIKGEPVKTPQITPSLPNIPPEALRFFYIDHAWLDAFIDGALSSANHVDPELDIARLYIKEVYNFYLRNDIHPLEGQTPPIPRYGFILRSSVIKAIPDLKTTVTCRKFVLNQWVIDKRDPVVRLTRMDSYTILCLLDCLPEEINDITFAQPPHQQRFKMGAGITVTRQPANTVTERTDLVARMIYTKNPPADGIWGPLLEESKTLDQDHFFDADTRCINPHNIAEGVRNLMMTKFPDNFSDKFANSAMLGLILNDASYQFVIRGLTVPPAAVPTWTKQLWVGNLQPLTADTSTPALEAPKGSVAPAASKVALLVNAGPTQPSRITPPPPPSNKQNSLPSVSIPPRLDTTSVIPVRGTNATGPTGPIKSQFTLVIHPDYRPPPPTPFMETASKIVYAPMDYLPTETKRVYDLIIAIRRRVTPEQSPGLHLQELSVEMPVSDGKDDPKADGFREPLIDAKYKSRGVYMTSNPRFVPTLYSADDPQSKGRSVLGVKLIPRSAQADASILIAADGRTSDASVRLAEVRIARIVQPKSLLVAGIGKDGKGTGLSQPEEVGICKIVLKEKYVLSNGELVTVVTDGEPSLNPRRPKIPLWALKRKGGDVDSKGAEV